MPLCLCRVEVLDNPLVVLLDDILRNTLHTENLNVETLSVRKCIFDLLEGLLVHLVHVDRQTTSCVQPLAATLAFEVLRFLMGDE